MLWQCKYFLLFDVNCYFGKVWPFDNKKLGLVTENESKQ